MGTWKYYRGSMDFVVAESFYTSYKSLSNKEAAVVDDGIRRLLEGHRSGWARQGRIEGDSGGAWIVTVKSSTIAASLYWDYVDPEEIILLAIVIDKT